jgi:hypothetical protein
MSSAFLHPAIPMADYAADRFDLPPTLNSGLAHVLLTKSAAHVRYAHPKLNPAWAPDEDRRFDVGKAAHAVLLEGKTVSALPYDNYRTKAAQEARDEVLAEGGYPVLAEHASDIACMVTSARAKLAASPDLQGLGELLAERTVLWRAWAASHGSGCEVSETGVLCDPQSHAPDIWLRCRPDWLTADYKVIVSVKTTRASAEPDAFLRTILNGGYDVQSAFELAGIKAATGVTPTHYIWLAMECEAPFACSLVGLSPMLRDLGERKMGAAVAAWSHCLATDEWPDYGEHVAYPDPPEWALTRFAERYGISDPTDESVEAL